MEKRSKKSFANLPVCGRGKTVINGLLVNKRLTVLGISLRRPYNIERHFIKKYYLFRKAGGPPFQLLLMDHKPRRGVALGNFFKKLNTVTSFVVCFFKKLNAFKSLH